MSQKYMYILQNVEKCFKNSRSQIKMICTNPFDSHSITLENDHGFGLFLGLECVFTHLTRETGQLKQKLHTRVEFKKPC